jgi:uncharacterized membrane protein YuzA (DUF378 family)
MKASRWNTMDLSGPSPGGPPCGRTPGPPHHGAARRWVGFALLSIGALGSGFLGGFDLVYEPFGSIMVFSQTVSTLMAFAILFRLVAPRLAPQPVPIRVRS